MQIQVVGTYGPVTCRLRHHPFVFREGSGADSVKCVTYSYGVAPGTANPQIPSRPTCTQYKLEDYCNTVRQSTPSHIPKIFEPKRSIQFSLPRCLVQISTTPTPTILTEISRDSSATLRICRENIHVMSRLLPTSSFTIH